MRPYFQVIPSALAILNGLIAVGVAQLGLTQEHKVRLLEIAAIIGVLAIAATIYSQWQIEHDRKKEAANRRAVREQLGKYMLFGADLKQRCLDDGWALTKADSDNWEIAVEAFLDTNLDGSYRPRFLYEGGTPNELPFGPNMTAEIQNGWRHINGRIFRLEQFLQELN